MKAAYIRFITSPKVRRAAGWSLISLGVIGMVAPLMPGVWFFLIGGKLLDTENKLVPAIVEWQKSDRKIAKLIEAYKYFYGHILPDYLQHLSDRRRDFDITQYRFVPYIVTTLLTILTLAGISVVAITS